MVIIILTMFFGIFVGIPMLVASVIVNNDKKKKPKSKSKTKVKKPTCKGTIEFTEK